MRQTAAKADNRMLMFSTDPKGYFKIKAHIKILIGWFYRKCPRDVETRSHSPESHETFHSKYFYVAFRVFSQWKQLRLELKLLYMLQEV